MRASRGQQLHGCRFWSHVNGPLLVGTCCGYHMHLLLCILVLCTCALYNMCDVWLQPLRMAVAAVHVHTCTQQLVVGHTCVVMRIVGSACRYVCKHAMQHVSVMSMS